MADSLLLIHFQVNGRLSMKDKKEQLLFKIYNVTFKGYANID